MVALAATVLLAVHVQSVSQHVELNCIHSPTQQEAKPSSLLQVSSNKVKLRASKLDPIPPLGMVKVHKSASSTMQKIVQSLGITRNMSMMFPADGIHMGWPKPFPGAENIVKNGLPDHQYQILKNHAIFNEKKWSAYLGHDPVFITLLREPVSQAISAFNFFAHHKDWAAHINWLGGLPLEVEQNDDIARFRNPQAWDMGWYEYVGWTAQYDYNKSMINQWLSTLDGPFNRMGSHLLQDYFDEGLVLLKRRLKVDIKELAYIYCNKGSSHVEPTEKERELLKKLLPVDTALYEHFNRTFAKFWQRDEQENKELLVQLKQAGTEYKSFCAPPSQRTRGMCRIWHMNEFGAMPTSDEAHDNLAVHYDEAVGELLGCVPPACAETE